MQKAEGTRRIGKNARTTVSPHRAAARIRKLGVLQPRLAMIMGSGFQGLAPRLDVKAELAYSKIPGFEAPSVAGHAGRVLIGDLAGVEVVVLCGRSHFYEGHSLATVTFPVRALAALGIRDLLLTNAAGAIHPRFRPGDFMGLKDHINFMGTGPLRGPARDGLERFVDLSQTYDPGLRRLLKTAAAGLKIRFHEGVYLAVAGPNYETPAEIRAFRSWGADAVGMSTVPEAIVARQCGLSVAGLSCLTNLAAGRTSGRLSHEDVLRTGLSVAETNGRLLEEFARLYGQRR